MGPNCTKCAPTRAIVLSTCCDPLIAKVFIGSANLDPRSLRINTEMGLLVKSERFNRSVREALEGDFASANAWRLELRDDGKVYWVADDQVLAAQPAASFMQRIEDWFFAHLPLEDEL